MKGPNDLCVYCGNGRRNRACGHWKKSCLRAVQGIRKRSDQARHKEEACMKESMQARVRRVRHTVHARQRPVYGESSQKSRSAQELKAAGKARTEPDVLPRSYSLRGFTYFSFPPKRWLQMAFGWEQGRQVVVVWLARVLLLTISLLCVMLGLGTMVFFCVTWLGLGL